VKLLKTKDNVKLRKTNHINFKAATKRWTAETSKLWILGNNKIVSSSAGGETAKIEFNTDQKCSPK
jgi:hypothetical protein